MCLQLHSWEFCNQSLMSAFGFHLFCCSSYSSLTSCLSSYFFWYPYCSVPADQSFSLKYQLQPPWVSPTPAVLSGSLHMKSLYCFLMFSFLFNTFILPSTSTSKLWLSPPLTFPELSTDVRWLMLQKEKTAIHHEISLSDEIHVNSEEIFTLKLRIKLKKMSFLK